MNTENTEQAQEVAAVTTIAAPVKRGRGRPAKGFAVRWSAIRHLWKTNTDKELALRLNVSVPLIHRKRLLLIASGFDAAPKRPSYSRVRKEIKAKFSA
jgi:hypothetical protein